jgi:hypothetical protein
MSQADLNAFLAGGGNRPTPAAAKSVIANLPSHTITSQPDELDVCPVCQEELQIHDVCTTLPCSHVFHKDDCLKPWLQEHHTCPVCRFELITDNQEFNETVFARMQARESKHREATLSQLDTTTTSESALYFPVGTPVRITGLQQQARLNTLVGHISGKPIADSRDVTQLRYPVQIPNHTTVYLLRRQHLIPTLLPRHPTHQSITTQSPSSPGARSTSPVVAADPVVQEEPALPDNQVSPCAGSGPCPMDLRMVEDTKDMDTNPIIPSLKSLKRRSRPVSQSDSASSPKTSSIHAAINTRPPLKRHKSIDILESALSEFDFEQTRLSQLEAMLRNAS